MSGDTGGKELERMLEDELGRLLESEAQLEKQKQSIVAEIDSMRRRRELVQALLRDMGHKDQEPEEPGSNGKSSVTVSKPVSVSPVDIAYEILVARGRKPMHYEELVEKVIDAGGRVGGEDPAQTLLSRISRDPRFVRPEKRGWYAASAHYPKARSVGSRKAKVTAGKKGRPSSGRKGRATDQDVVPNG